MKACITIKNKYQMRHQMVYTGDGDRVHCTFWCGLEFPSMYESVQAFEIAQMCANTKWPEGAEL